MDMIQISVYKEVFPMTDQAILFMVNEKMLKHGHVSEAVYDKIQQDIITGQ